MEEFVNLDREIFLFLNNLGSPRWDWFWFALSNTCTGLPLYLLLIYLSFRNYGWKITLLNLVLATLLIITSAEVGYSIKQFFERPRPCGQEGVQEFVRLARQGCTTFSFVSNHATNSASVAVYASLLFKQSYRKLSVLLLVWPLLTSYSRIYLGVHYPTDVVSGMILGGFLGFLFHKLQGFLILFFDRL